MYEIDVLEDNKWLYYWESEDIRLIDQELFNLTNKGIKTRVLLDGILLCWINGTEYQYWYWKNKYARDKGNKFDAVKSYHEHQKKKVKRRDE